MEPIYIVAIISFAFGVFGYVITQFWLRPILRYRKLKHQVASDLAGYVIAETVEGADKKTDRRTKDRLAAIRRHSEELSSSYSYDLPPWYRLVLQRRGESPVEASKYLMKLSNTRNPEHAKGHVEKIKACLKIE
ncbi:hypothetical protein ACFL03_13185 [Thermodesulfobacteriota bacterium]